MRRAYSIPSLKMRTSSFMASKPVARARPWDSTPPRSIMANPACSTAQLSYVLQNEDGQTADVHSVSAGLDYPGVGPEHSYWKDAGRVSYAAITDQEALEAFEMTAQREGIIPAPSLPRRRLRDEARERHVQGSDPGD